MRIIVRNGRVILDDRIIPNGGVIIQGDKISAIFENDNYSHNQEDQIIDAKGKYISPGFIDIHSHGAGGHDFMDGTVEAIVEATKKHMHYGTTSIVPTTLTSTMEDLFQTLDNVKIAKSIKGIPNILGVHLEGPYFSMEQRGAQDPKYIKSPNKEEYIKILEYSKDIVRWTIAPELEGAMDMGRELSSRDIICSIGHSDAIYEDVLEAHKNGYSLITHFYSGMSMVKRIQSVRYAGVVEAGYLMDDMYVEVIADGMHLPESLLKLIYKIKGPDRICLVTDSMRGAGMPPGESILGNLQTGQKVIIEDGIAKLPDRSAFAGSVATANRLIRTMIQIAEVPLVEAVKMLTKTPAAVMKISDRKGSIKANYDADIIIFDDAINIDTVIIGGGITKGNISIQKKASK